MTGSAGTPHPDCQDRHRDSTLTRLQSPDQEGRQNPERRSPGAGGSPHAGDDPACPETGGYREIMYPRTERTERPMCADRGVRHRVFDGARVIEQRP